jgi:hypothetical protein
MCSLLRFNDKTVIRYPKAVKSSFGFYQNEAEWVIQRCCALSEQLDAMGNVLTISANKYVRKKRRPP